MISKRLARVVAALYLGACALLILVVAAMSAHAQRLSTHPDPRVCYDDLLQIPRYADGTIKRSTTQRALFVRSWPCPTTGAVTGTCPGWQINHIIPLANGGCDAPHNMDWMPPPIKTCTEQWCRDRWERKVYARPQILVPLAW